VPNAAQELDRYLADIPEDMKKYLADEFGATFLGPVVLPKPALEPVPSLEVVIEELSGEN